ncbi:DUF4345 family protein [Sagittula salina]|uniref:DUF4345 family protein n=1 Tax=Sagittula salina TaxID=2820268 RepID=A0A940MRP4_9RHOB|nr:DUF4345 family protein [Sagittula salina]MBP0482817.1 DUF4345 family protein [Sagittula salina]
MLTAVNIIIAVMTIAFGAMAFSAPGYAARALDLAPTGSTMGLTELRASAGGLFVAMGLACLIVGDWTWAALGIAYTGAATGRVLSIFIDRPPQPKAFVWFLLEALPAAWLLTLNWPA